MAFRAKADHFQLYFAASASCMVFQYSLVSGNTASALIVDSTWSESA
jgi:hypothetical protein